VSIVRVALDDYTNTNTNTIFKNNKTIRTATIKTIKHNEEKTNKTTTNNKYTLIKQ